MDGTRKKELVVTSFFSFESSVSSESDKEDNLEVDELAEELHDPTVSSKFFLFMMMMMIRSNNNNNLPQFVFLFGERICGAFIHELLHLQKKLR